MDASKLKESKQWNYEWLWWSLYNKCKNVISQIAPHVFEKQWVFVLYILKSFTFHFWHKHILPTHRIFMAINVLLYKCLLFNYTLLVGCSFWCTFWIREPSLDVFYSLPNIYLANFEAWEMCLIISERQDDISKMDILITIFGSLYKLVISSHVSSLDVITWVL